MIVSIVYLTSDMIGINVDIVFEAIVIMIHIDERKGGGVATRQNHFCTNSLSNLELYKCALRVYLESGIRCMIDVVLHLDAAAFSTSALQALICSQFVHCAELCGIARGIVRQSTRNCAQSRVKYGDLQAICASPRQTFSVSFDRPGKRSIFETTLFERRHTAPVLQDELSQF